MILGHLEHKRSAGKENLTHIRVLNVTPICSRCSKLVPQQPPQTFGGNSVGKIWLDKLLEIPF